MEGQLPVSTKLIVLIAFDRDEDGLLLPAFEPREMPDEQRAIRTAKEMAQRHPGVVTWSRAANLALGEYGEPVVLYKSGDVPERD